MLGPLAMAGGSKFISEINQFLSSEIANMNFFILNLDKNLYKNEWRLKCHGIRYIGGRQVNKTNDI